MRNSSLHRQSRALSNGDDHSRARRVLRNTATHSKRTMRFGCTWDESPPPRHDVRARRTPQRPAAGGLQPLTRSHVAAQDPMHEHQDVPRAAGACDAASSLTRTCECETIVRGELRIGGAMMAFASVLSLRVAGYVWKEVEGAHSIVYTLRHGANTFKPHAGADAE